MNQIPGKSIYSKAQKSLEAVLADIPFVILKKSNNKVEFDNKQIDIILEASVSGKPARFIVEVKSQGEPRFVRMAIAQMKSYLPKSKDAYGILIAPYLSDVSREICKEEGIGCMDLAGNAFLSYRNIFIEKSGRSNPFTTVRIAKSVFSPKSSRILRVLLSDLSKKWYVEDLSIEAGISIGLASRIKQSLLSEEWIKEENKRFYLIKPEEALNQWVNNYTYEKNRIFSFYSGWSEDQIETAIKKECEKRKCQYGLALFSGARKVAPFVRFMKFFAYIDGDIDEIADSLQMKKVESGANVTLLQPYDKGIFYGLQDINGIKVISDIQLYLDLKSYKSRGEEAAQAVFEQRIKPRW